ncbi:hypothetical protein ACXX9E_29505 [Pseudomonas sp. GNP014]
MSYKKYRPCPETCAVRHDRPERLFAGSLLMKFCWSSAYVKERIQILEATLHSPAAPHQLVRCSPRTGRRTGQRLASRIR